MAPRTILYTGKGGVGKTSVAAATARRCAADGARTLVISTDPAHSLQDVLQAPVEGKPTKIAKRLHAQQVQAQDEMELHWSAVSEWLGTLLMERGVNRIAAEELTVPPGGDELFSLLVLKAHAEADEFDVVVVDCAPTGETLRLLSFPDAARWWLDKVLGKEQSMLSAARPLARMFLDIQLPDEKVVAEVQRLVKNLVAMHELLRDASRVSMRLVMTPDRMVVAEAMRTFTYLNLYGYLTDAVVVNRVFPDAAAEAGPHTPDAWRSSWNAAQQEGLVEVRESFAGLPVIVTPYLPSEPIGADALADLAAAQEGGSDVLSPVTHRGLSVEQTDEGFLMSLPLPLAHAADLGLQRRDDELVVTVGEHRRVLTLPAALQRCVVEGASVRDGLLRVRFVPDEEVWPRG